MFTILIDPCLTFKTELKTHLSSPTFLQLIARLLLCHKKAFFTLSCILLYCIYVCSVGAFSLNRCKLLSDWFHMILAVLSANDRYSCLKVLI